MFSPTIHLELKTRRVVFISDTDILGGTDSPKKQKEKESNSGGKTKIYDYFGSKHKNENCVFKAFLTVFRSCPTPDYRISTFVFLVRKCIRDSKMGLLAQTTTFTTLWSTNAVDEN